MIKYEITYTVVIKSGEKLAKQKFEIDLDFNSCNFDAIIKLREYLSDVGYKNFWCEEIDSTETEDQHGNL